jgi:hypothetical protein
MVLPKEGGTEVVREAVSAGTADMGAGGMYFTQDSDSIAPSYPFMHVSIKNIIICGSIFFQCILKSFFFFFFLKSNNKQKVNIKKCIILF